MSSLQRRFTTRRTSTITTKNGDTANSANGGSTLSSSTEKSHSSVFKTIKEATEIARKDLPILLDPQTISGMLDAVGNLNNLDDRKMLLEHVLILMANTPPDTHLAKKLQNAVVSLLYNDLTHPPSTFVSKEYTWRSADGSRNNVNLPEMGKAGTPYARSVQQIHPLPSHMLPDAGLVFDTLLKREKFVKHPAGLSSLMFSFAALVIHTCFRTSHTDWSINETSSYVDLSPLYGVNQEQQDNVRVRDGRGLLHPDSFAEDRLLLLPPAVCVLLVLFSRNHNYIARKLLDINERGTWFDPDQIPQDEKRTGRLIQQDEELFQTARLINCGWFAGVVFSDYFSAILGFVRQGLAWSLNPFEEIRKSDHTFVERGAGNAVSVEFNCLYRWHATTSVQDEQWTVKAFEKFFGGKKPEEVTPMDFKIAAKKAQEHEPDCHHWTFGDLKRQSDGSFSNADLARVLMDATSHPASAFKARGTPAVMRLNEIMGIEQSRRWGVCSLNDFRKFLGLKPYSSFLEWNSDPEIASAASHLYHGDINNLELYVGLQAEEAKPVVDGAGLCPGYTISRAILADAISLTRGDRFYTTDMTPHNYTAWGLRDCARDTSNPGYGSMLGRLFLRTLPDWYTSDSVYTWFPLMTPEAMEGYTKEMGKEVYERYAWSRPIEAPGTHVVTEYAVVSGVMKDSGFRPPYADRVGAMVKGPGFFITYDQNEEGLIEQKDIFDILIGHRGSLEEVVRRFETAAKYVIERDSYYLAGKETKNIDISAVLKMIPIHWVASEIAGITLKTPDNPHGEWTDSELFDMLGVLYDYIFLETEPEKELTTADLARKYMKEIQAVIKANLRAFGGSRFSFVGLLGSMFTSPKKTSHEFLEKIVASGKPHDEIANAILSVAIVATVELSQAMINMVNLYLDAPFRQELVHGVKKPADWAAFAREALRIDPPFAGVYREAITDKRVGELSVKTNERLFLSIAKANLNPDVFPNPVKVDITRPAELYIGGDGISRSFGNDFVHSVMGSVLKMVYSLPNLRRAPGMSGKLKRFHYDTNGTEYYQYLDKNMEPTAWATSLVLQYDA